MSHTQHVRDRRSHHVTARVTSPSRRTAMRDLEDAPILIVNDSLGQRLSMRAMLAPLGQTIVEEEIQRASHMSSPSRVRRFMSRFLVVLVVALSIEALVAVFRYSRDEPSNLPYAAAIGLMAAALLAAWGVFIKLNLGAEALEPEALAAAKKEDTKVEKPG